MAAAQICGQGCKPGAAVGAALAGSSRYRLGAAVYRAKPERLAQGSSGRPALCTVSRPGRPRWGRPFCALRPAGRALARALAAAGAGQSVCRPSAPACSGAPSALAASGFGLPFTPPALGAVVGGPAAPLGAPIRAGGFALLRAAASPCCAASSAVCTPAPMEPVRLCRAAVVVVGFSPASPRPAAPAGGSREREASGLGCCRTSAPATVPGLSASPAATLCAGGATGQGRGNSENPSFLDFVLDCGANPWYSVLARPVPLLRGLPFPGYPWTAKDRSTERPGGFFMPGRFLLPGLFRCSDSGEVNRQTGPPVSVFSASKQSQNCQPMIFSPLRERPIAGALDTRVPGG